MKTQSVNEGMEKALWREVACKVQAWGSEGFASFKVLPQATPAWLRMRLGKLLLLGMLQDRCPDKASETECRATAP